MKTSISAISQKRKQDVLQRCKPRRADQGRPQMSAKGLRFEMAERTNAIAAGGVPLIHAMCESIGLKKAVGEKVHVLKQHNPYYESDHVLNIAFNILAGGVGSSRVDLQACKLEYSIVSPK